MPPLDSSCFPLRRDDDDHTCIELACLHCRNTIFSAAPGHCIKVSFMLEHNARIPFQWATLLKALLLELHEYSFQCFMTRICSSVIMDL